MKKYLAFFGILLVLAFIFIIFHNQNKKSDIVGSDWKLESLTDLDEKLPPILPEEDPSDKPYDMILHFDKDSFELSDLTDNRVWKGSYTAELVDKNTYKLNLNFKDTKPIVLGVLGTRVYQDKTTIRSITFSINNKIFSFTAME